MHRVVQGSIILLALGGLFFPLQALSAPASGKVVDVVQVKGFIDAPSVTYLEDRIAAVQGSDSDEAIIVELDSDGGLVGSISRVVDDMLSSRVPVVVWVAPRGATAASGGALLLEAGSLAYMADAARLGTMLPVNLNSVQRGRTEVSRTSALVRRLSSARNRQPQVPLDLLRTGRSVTSRRALAGGAIDGVASSLADVLRQMDGRTVTSQRGVQKTLETWDQNSHEPSVGFRFEEMNLLARLLHAVTTPEIALFLLLVGAYGLIFETYNPGIGLAAIIGIVSLLLSFYALNTLPTNWLGVLVVIVAIVLFVVDVQLSGFGIWSAGGILGLIAGAWLMFAGAPSAAHVAPIVIGAAVIVSLLFFVSVMTAALRVRLRRPISGEEGIVGTTGEARTDIAPEGTVFTKGTLWRARTMETGIASGSTVRIKATEGLVLLVEPISEHDLDEERTPNLADDAAVRGDG
jgi:membrane-bound serine protease (ClpP class)